LKRRSSSSRLPTEPSAAAAAARLRHVDDARPGLRRRRAGGGFVYFTPRGGRVRDEARLRRIRSLAIPPAWTDVWICADADGHVQATGRDARGRKQYRYHPRWRAVRDTTKYARLAEFGRVLPRLRARVARDLARRGLPREKVLATLVRLLQTTYLRIGNEEYARANHSFGLTTFEDRHASIAGARLCFHFRGKSRREHDVCVNDALLSKIVRRCRDLPGQELFQYVDEDGTRHAIDSGDVNDYLRRVAGADVTAKDFRTWAGTLLAARELARAAKTSRLASKSAVLRVVESVAAELGNTPAVCRKAYIHPAVLEALGDPRMRRGWKRRPAATGRARLTAEEVALLHFLDASAARTAASAASGT
jgi:DNA topoisomerase-1